MAEEEWLDSSASRKPFPLLPVIGAVAVIGLIGVCAVGLLVAKSAGTRETKVADAPLRPPEVKTEPRVELPLDPNPDLEPTPQPERRPDPPRPTPPQPKPTLPETKKPESKKEEPKKPDLDKPEPKKPEPVSAQVGNVTLTVFSLKKVDDKGDKLRPGKGEVLLVADVEIINRSPTR